MGNGITGKPLALALIVGMTGAALWLGGWPWALLMLAALAEIPFTGGDGEEWVAVFPALLWPALALATGDRRLMFPFAVHLATVMACRTRLWAGVAVVALFAGIRWWQAATAHVLGVEMLVAAPAVAAGLWVSRWSPEGVEGRFLAGLAASAVGLIGLLV